MLCYGSIEPHLSNYTEPDKTDKSEHSEDKNGLCPPLKLINLYLKSSLFFSASHQ